MNLVRIKSLPDPEIGGCLQGVCGPFDEKAIVDEVEEVLARP